jgi:hypothetical protein
MSVSSQMTNMQHEDQDDLNIVLQPQHQLPQSAKGYSPLMLEAYDMLIMRLSVTLIWRCPTPHLLRLYSTYLSHRHLEVGVGTGYLLEHGVFPTLTPTLTLLDCNPTVLAHARRRLSRYQPTVVVQDVMQAQWPVLPRYASIGLNLVLHALSGAPHERMGVFSRLADRLTSDGVLFGSTVLGIYPDMSAAAQKISRKWLAGGLFNNQTDTLDSIQVGLARYFDDVEVYQIGYLAFFVAKRPIRPSHSRLMQAIETSEASS